MDKRYSYIERSHPATPRNKRLTDAIAAASSTDGGLIGGGGGTSYWQLVTTDADGNALAEEDQYLVPVGAYPVVSLSDIVAYATTNPVANTPVTGYDTFGLVKIASGNGLIVTDGVLSIDSSAVGGLDEEALALYLTLNKYVKEDMLTTKGYLMLSSPLTGYVIADAYTAISPTDTVLTAIGKLERRFDGYVDLTTDQTIGGVKTFTETIFGNKDVVCYATDSAVANTPVASTTTFGLVKIGENITVVDGMISAVAQQSGVQFTPGTALELTANSVLNVKFGTTGTTACAGNDSRLSDARKCPYSLSWSGYSSGSYDGSEAVTISIPSDTSQLTNGARYITGIDWSMVSNAVYNNSSGVGSKYYLNGDGKLVQIPYSHITGTPDLSAYVTLSTSQTISGAKTFTSDVVCTKDVVAFSTSSAVANTPVASTTTFGLVKIGSGISVSGGVISVSGTGGGGTTVSWGSGDSNYCGLSVAGTSKNVSLNGHTHSLSRTTSGSGNAVTNVTLSGMTVTVTYGNVYSKASELTAKVTLDGETYFFARKDPTLGIGFSGGNTVFGYSTGAANRRGNLYLNTDIGPDYHTYIYNMSERTTSDMRLKTKTRNLTNILDSLSALDVFEFYYNSSKKKNIEIGVSAQAVQAHYPLLVSSNSDGYLSLNYNRLNTVFAIGGLKELYTLHLSLANEVRSGAHWRLTKDEQIRQLQRECAELRGRVNELEKGGVA